MLKISKPMVIYEMANNHMGNVDHGINIINELSKVSEEFEFDFGIKFQYRDLDSFIHPDFKDRMDLKFIKRFSETRLSEDEFKLLISECKKLSFTTICTPFDEKSVELITKHEFDFLKIASCSVKDWPLLIKISETNLPIISSSGGASIEDVDNLVSFLEHKKVKFALMHCVGIYPTEEESLAMNRIDLFKDRYPQLVIGFSTHEDPDNLLPVSLAVAKGALIFEKHVGLETNQYSLNEYSSSPEQIEKWLTHLQRSLNSCGRIDPENGKIDQREIDSLSDLKRGVFAKNNIKKESPFYQNDVFFAMPNSKSQMTSEEFSKHNLEFYAVESLNKNEPINNFRIGKKDVRSKISTIVHTVKSQLKLARIVINPDSKIELSHHYGIEEFEKTGATIINCINNEHYCKKLIIQTPGQMNPEHMHKIKEETFQVLWGSFFLIVDGVKNLYNPGDIVTVIAGQKHSFNTEKGVIFEEVSTTHYIADSYYSDPEMPETKFRKTELFDWLSEL